MALFNKIFSSNKRKNVNQTTANQSQFPFNNEQVRVLLYRECDWRGRRLLFDSSAVQCVPLPTNTTGNNQNTAGYIEICDGFGYKYCRPNADCNNIGEMVFGAVAMSFRGTSLKVHWLQSPTRVLCSQVFLSPIHTKTFNQSSDSNNTSSDVSSIDTSSMNSFSLSLSVCLSDNMHILGDKFRTNPLDVPVDMTDSSFIAYSGGDSGYSGTDPWNMSNYPYSSGRSSFGSMYSDQESLRKLSIDSTNVTDSVYGNKNSDGSLHRRVLKNMSTSFENQTSMSDLIGFIEDNYNRNGGGVGGSDGCVPNIRRNSEIGENRSSNPEMKRKKNTSVDTISANSSYHGSNNGSNRNSSRRAKLGLAVCITLNESVEKEMQIFCSEHIALLESMLCRLRVTAENAYKNRQNFIQIMLRAWHSTTLWIRDLFTAPRLNNPVWLTLSCGNFKNPDILAQSFMTDLSWLLTHADTKDTNFFVSTLLTAILTNHLGWVGTVAPISTHNSATTSSNIVSMTQHRTKISEISKSHPYSALWAQIGDLYGSIGNPPKISKTIICGRDTKSLDKILNVLTYFIRCGEIKREFKESVIEKDVLTNIMHNINKFEYKYETENERNNLNKEFIDEDDMKEKKNNNEFKIKTGLSRTSTCVKNLSVLNSDRNTNENYTTNNSISSVEALNEQKMYDVLRSMKKNVMNDIPNVLVYRDSRFVRQELRIGNYLMDTGIEMNQKLKTDLKEYQIKPNDKIRLTVTSPENIEFNITSTDDYIKNDINNERKLNGAIPKTSLSELITANSLGGKIITPPSKLLWGGVESKKDCNVNLDENKIENGVEIFENVVDNTIFKRSKSLFTKSSNAKNVEHINRFKITRKSSVPKIEDIPIDVHLETSCTSNLRKTPSLSDLITANSIGSNQRLFWGVEPHKQADSLELIKHMEKNNQLNGLKKDNNNGVVFVLGDDEALINIKTHKINDLSLMRAENFNGKLNTSPSSCSLECAAENHLDEQQLHKSISSVSIIETDLLQRKMCKHKFKKHSGVKFNFEQYPQIATNYMKNKNLDISNYNFLEKGPKIEKEMRMNYGASTSTLTQCSSITKTTEEEDEDECECCRGDNAHILTTPSNASELEFSSDITENNNNNNNNNNTNFQQTSSKKESLLITTTTPTNTNELTCNMLIRDKCEDININNINETIATICNIKQQQQQQMKIISIPLPKSTSRKSIEDKNDKVLLLFKPGFIPSLFTGISDHYIPDMVLQGTYTPPTKWESALKHDLALSSHCAILEQTPTENIAIIANTDKWDVRVISSQTSTLPNTSNGLVGMSQLVASMLETVHVMWGAGISAYHCMSFMESKLQEIYFQSETLAAFLLATEFCSLNTLTSALNLSANDVPFLLSVASVHSPQVTKKYGVSFR